MRRMITVAILVLLLSFALFVPVTVNAVTPPNTLVVGSIAMPETVDPAWSYDAASGELIFNVYEPLICYKVNRTLPPEEQGIIDEFVPGLATEWEIKEIDETSPQGVHWSYRFIFKIRTGVTFHNGAELTTDDVEYSFERVLVQDRNGGPSWILYYPLLGCYNAPAWSEHTLINWIAKIDQAIENNATHVWFNFHTLLGPPAPMLQIKAMLQMLCQTWGSVLSKAFCTADPTDWDGEYTKMYNVGGDLNSDGVVDTKDSTIVGLHWPPAKYDITADPNCDTVVDTKDSTIVGINWGTGGPDYGWHWGWYKYHNPSVSPLDNPPRMCGTGPYKFDYIDYIDKKWHIIAFTGSGYWGGWPSALNSPSPGYQGYLDDVIYKVIENQTQRGEMFLACDLDFCYEPGLDFVIPSIECYRLETLAVDVLLYNIDITENTSYAGGPGGHGYPYGEFHRDGIPRDFFSDVHIRRAFSYAINCGEYIEYVYGGDANRTSTPMIVGLGPKEPIDIPKLLRDGGHLLNCTTLPPIPLWPCDPEEMVNEFKLAFGGSLEDPGPAWTTGFSFTLAYNSGNVPYMWLWEGLRDLIQSYHPLANINIQEVDFPTYLEDLYNPPYYRSKMVVFKLIMQADPSMSPDVFPFAFHFMHTDGAYASLQSYSNSTMDWLILDSISPQAMGDVNYRARRCWDVGMLYSEDMPSLPLAQPFTRHWQKTWVKGWYYNPMYPGDYYYHIWKEMP